MIAEGFFFNTKVLNLKALNLTNCKISDPIATVFETAINQNKMRGYPEIVLTSLTLNKNPLESLTAFKGNEFKKVKTLYTEKSNIPLKNYPSSLLDGVESLSIHMEM